MMVFATDFSDEAYDSSNGLLLTKSMDALFGRGYISFENDDKIILLQNVPRHAPGCFIIL